MPMYEYICSGCSTKFELLRAYSERDDSCKCIYCNKKGKMKRLSSLVASLSGKDTCESSGFT